MPRGLLSSRLQSSRNWVQTLALCPSYRKKFCIISLQYLRQTCVMRENDCVDVVSQEMVHEVLHLLLSVFFALAVFASVCMNMQGEVLIIQWLGEIRVAFLEQQERLRVLMSLFSHQFWPFLAASPCHFPPSLFSPSKNEICIISLYGPSSS